MPRTKEPYLSTCVWPEVQDAYVDEFGTVDPEIHELAGILWPSVHTRILCAIKDLDAGQRLLMKAVAIVSRRRREQPEQMTNLSGYLYVIFSHLLTEASRKQAIHDQLDNIPDVGFGATDGQEAEINQTILVREILSRADDWTREIYEYLILGYSFEELAPHYGMKPNRLRSKWSKSMAKIRKQIKKESRTAQQLTLQKPSVEA